MKTTPAVVDEKELDEQLDLLADIIIDSFLAMRKNGNLYYNKITEKGEKIWKNQQITTQQLQKNESPYTCVSVTPNK